MIKYNALIKRSVLVALLFFFSSCDSSQAKLEAFREKQNKELGSEIYAMSRFLQRNGTRFTAGMFLTENNDVFDTFATSEHTTIDFHRFILGPHILRATSKNTDIYPIIVVTGPSSTGGNKPKVTVGITARNTITNARFTIRDHIVENNTTPWPTDLLKVILVGPLPGLTAEIFSIYSDKKAQNGKFIVEATVKDVNSGKVIRLEQSVNLERS